MGFFGGLVFGFIGMLAIGGLIILWIHVTCGGKSEENKE